MVVVSVNNFLVNVLSFGVFEVIFVVVECCEKDFNIDVIVLMGIGVIFIVGVDICEL